MSFFDLDPTATRNVLDQATLHPLDPGDLKPGWFSGAWKAPVTGVASAFNDAALLLGDAATPAIQAAVRPVDELFKTTTLQDFFARQQRYNVENIQALTPDPRTTGVVGQVAHGLINVVPEVLAGGPEVAATLQGYKAFRGAQAEGLDNTTALGMGAINAVSTWAGMKVPMSLGPGAGLFKNVAAGAAINVPVGAASRGATAAWLEANGHPDMAKQYEVMDAGAIATDAIMGAAFGTLGHYEPAIAAKIDAWRNEHKDAVLPSDVDAALTMANQHHVELDTAPGVPADPIARAVHVEQMNHALDDLLQGRPVEADPNVTQQNFLEDPHATAVRAEIGRAVEEHMGPEWVALQHELEARGLPVDDLDLSGPAIPGAARAGEAKATPEIDPGKQVELQAVHPETGKTVKYSERADVALRDNAERLEKMKGLLSCLLG